MANTPRFSTNPSQGTQETMSKVQDKAKDLGHQAKETAANVGHQTKEAASNLGQQAKDTASNLASQARDAAGNLGQQAREFASTAQDRADDALSTVGERMSGLAGSLRENAPREGMLGGAAGAVADRLEASGQYLQEHGLSDMAGDITSLVRQHPMQACLVGFGLGFLFGMAWRR